MKLAQFMNSFVLSPFNVFIFYGFPLF